MIEKLNACLNKKLFADDVKKFDKQLRSFKSRIESVGINESDDRLMNIHETIKSNFDEMKRVLRENDLY